MALIVSTSFDRHNFFSSLQDKFSMNDEERYQIVTCAETYANSGTLSSMKNAMWRIFNRSDWTVTKKMLASHAVVFLTRRYDALFSETVFAQKSLALSEFLLRFLSTKIGPTCYLGMPLWNSEKLDEVSLEEIIERASEGDGTSFPIPGRSITVLMIKKESESFVKEVDAFDLYLHTDPTRKSEWEFKKSLDSLNPENSLQPLLGPLEKCEQAISSARSVLMALNHVEFDEVASLEPEEKLYTMLREARKVRVAFNRIVADLHGRSPSIV